MSALQIIRYIKNYNLQIIRVLYDDLPKYNVTLQSYRLLDHSQSNEYNRMKKILFLHGFFATGSCPMAKALREAFDGQAIMLTPDPPLHPKEALRYVRITQQIAASAPAIDLITNNCQITLAKSNQRVTLLYADTKTAQILNIPVDSHNCTISRDSDWSRVGFDGVNFV